MVSRADYPPRFRSPDCLEIIEQLKDMPRLLDAELSGLSESARRLRPAEDQWSIDEVVGHLRDLTEVWHKRLHMVWAQTDPVFTSFDGEASVIEHNYQEADIESLLAATREWRSRTIELLSEAVDWSRLGSQGGVGRRTLKQFAAFLVSHDRDHLAQIRSLKALQTKP